VIERLRGLIVSVQAPGSLLDTPATIALLARVAEANGAAGVRVQGGATIGAVKRAVGVPVIGLVKRTYDGFSPYITPSLREVAEIAAAGADIIAFDATARPRPGGLDVAGLIAAIHARGALAMADCSGAADGVAAAEAGADLVATTLCGYTEETAGRALPALDVLRDLVRTGRPAIAEGGVGSPADLAAAMAAGAHAVVVGTAITNVDVLVRRFAAGIPT
jgi:N-acylglucosamine-6-phosphate 2-epimerase